MALEELAGLHEEFRQHIAMQPYSLVMDKLRLTVGDDVFPPDMGFCARNMARFSMLYNASSALDMGCGTGYIGLSLKRNGVAEVWLSDIHPRAVACAIENAEQNPEVGNVTVVQSDLFASIPEGKKFELIVFNQPFGPGADRRVCGCGSDGGYEITRKFLLGAPAHMEEGAPIVMAFSDRESPEHDPKNVAGELGYSVVTLMHAYYGDANNYIYEIKPGG